MHNIAIQQLSIILCLPRVRPPSVTVRPYYGAPACISWTVPFLLVTCSSHKRNDTLFLKGYQTTLISVFKIRVCHTALSAGRWFQEAGPGMIRNSDSEEDNTDSLREIVGPCTVGTASRRIAKNMKEGSVSLLRGHKMAFYLQTCLRGIQWTVNRLRF